MLTFLLKPFLNTMKLYLASVFIIVAVVAQTPESSNDYNFCEARDYAHEKCGKTYEKNPGCFACLAQNCFIHHFQRDCESLSLCIQNAACQ